MKRTTVFVLLAAMFLVALTFLAASADARFSPPGRFGNAQTVGGTQLTYTWGKTIAILGYDPNDLTQTQKVGYRLDVTTDNDATAGTPVANWTVGSAPRFLISSSCKDQDATAGCDATYDYIKIYLVWSAGSAGDTGDDSSDHVLQTTQWVYASTTLTNVVSTTATAFDAGILCAGPVAGDCKFTWTAGPGTGQQNGAPSASALNYVGTYRIVVEARVTNSLGSQRTFHSDGCFYMGGNYRCSIPDDINYQRRQVGFLQVNEAATTFRPTDDCSTLDYRALRGQTVCALVTMPAAAWKYSGDIRAKKLTDFTPSLGSTIFSFYGMYCYSNDKCWVTVSKADQSQHGVVRLTVASDGSATAEGPYWLVTPGCTNAGCNTNPLQMRAAYYPDGTNGGKLVLAYSQQRGAANAGYSVMRSVWTWNEGTTSFALADQDRVTLTGSSNTNTFGALAMGRSHTSAGADLLLLCGASHVTGALNGGPTACALWEGDPAATAPTQSWTDVDGGSYTEATAFPSVCLAEGSDTIYMTHYYDQTNGGARLYRATRSGGTWTWGTSAQGFANSPAQDTADIGRAGASCIHTGTEVIWLLGHANDPAAYATPNAGIKKFTTADFNGQSPVVRNFPPNDGRGRTVAVWANNTLFTAALAEGERALWYRFYDTDIRPSSENASIDFSADLPAVFAPGYVQNSNLTGTQNRTFVFVEGAKVVVARFGVEETLTVNVSKPDASATVGEFYEEMNTATKNRTFTVANNAALDNYDFKLKAEGYGGLANEPWVLLGCTSACNSIATQSYTAPATTDPDTGSNYASGGLFVEEEIVVSSCSASPSSPRPVFARGESFGFTCTLNDEWETSVGNGAGSLLRSTTVDYIVRVATVGGGVTNTAVPITSSSSGLITTSANAVTVPADAGATGWLDTYTGTNLGGDTSYAGVVRVLFPSSTAVYGSAGSYGESSGFFEPDANYYLQSNAVAWGTVMRGDEQKATAVLANARDAVVAGAVRLGLQFVDATGQVVADHGVLHASGERAATYTLPSNAERGTWQVRYYVTQNATNNQNSMGLVTGTTFQHASVIGIASEDVDVAGQATTKYFNRGESLRFAGTLTHADGGAYRRLKADGTTEARTVTLHYYLNTRGSTGSFQKTGVAVSSATGIVTATTTDAAPPADAPDSYASATYGAAEATDWDVYLVDGGTPGTPGNVDGNYVNLTDFMDVDGNYYLLTQSVFTQTAMLRDDTQRVQATFAGVRGQAVPDGTTARVRWFDGGDTERELDQVTTTSGTTANADWRIGNTHTTGTAHFGLEINGADTGTFGNTMGVTSSNATNQWPLSATLTVESTDTNTTAGGNALKAYNRGESIVASGCLKHPDGGPLRRRAPSGDESRTMTLQLFASTGGMGSTGHVQGTQSVGPAACTFTKTLVLPANAPDTYTSPTSATNDGAYGWSLRVYDGTADAASAAQGNNAVQAGMLDADAGVYLDRYWEGRIDADATNIDFNTGSDGTTGPDADYARLYVKNVRGDASNQFNGLRVVRSLLNPNTLATTEAVTFALAPQGGGLYRGAMGEWAAWTTARVDYQFESADANGNTDEQADPAPVTKTGKAHYAAGRANVLDTHVLRTQPNVVTLSVVDSYDDEADNDLLDFSAGHFTDATVQGNWSVYVDTATSPETEATFQGRSSPFNLTSTPTGGAVLGPRDVYVNLTAGTDGRLKGAEWLSTPGIYNHHQRFDAPGSDYLPSEGPPPFWLITNQTDWLRSNRWENADADAAPGSLGVVTGTGLARWNSSTRDLGPASPQAVPGGACVVATGPGGAVHAWVNTSADHFTTTAASAAASFTTPNAGGTLTLPLPSPLQRYVRVALVLVGEGTRVDGCHVRHSIAPPTGLGDGLGAWTVDDLAVAAVATDRTTYDLDVDGSVEVTTRFTYVFLGGAPENESYPYLVTTELFKPGLSTGNGILAPSPAYVDASTRTNASTNNTGRVVASFTLTTTAQAGKDWYARPWTASTNATKAFFNVDPRIVAWDWFAHQYSNRTQPWENATHHNRWEEVRVEANISNNPEAFLPESIVVADDVDGVVLGTSMTYNITSSRFEAVWRWPKNATAGVLGTAHRPILSFTLNNQTAARQAAPATLFANFTIGNLWTAFSPADTAEAASFVIGAHLVWEWADQFNVRGAPYLVPANYTWTHREPQSQASVGQNPPTSSDLPTYATDHGSEPAFSPQSGAHHMRTGFGSTNAVAPAGTWLVRADADDGQGNTATRDESVNFNSPVTPWAFRCTGVNALYRVGQTVNLSCYFLEKQPDGSTVPVAPTGTPRVQWFAKSVNNATVTNLTGRDVMNLTYFRSDDPSAQAIYGDRLALAWSNFTVPLDLALYINRGVGYRVEVVHNGIAVESQGSLFLGPTESLYRIATTSDQVLSPGKPTTLTARTSLNHPALGPVAWAPDSCRTSYQTDPVACVGDQNGTVKLTIKAINASCNCWATYNDPEAPKNDGTVVTTWTEMEKDFRYTKLDGTWSPTFSYNWTPPGTISGQRFYVIYAAEFYGKNVTHMEEFVVNTLGGIDPLHVTFPSQVYLGETVAFDIGAHYLNATPRTGAAASIFVTVQEYPALNAVVSGANPTEVGEGAYIYNFTPLKRGQYLVRVRTPSATGDWETTSGTFWAEHDTTRNLTRIEQNVTAYGESVLARVSASWMHRNDTWGAFNESFRTFWAQGNGTWAAWNASFDAYRAQDEATWAAWNASFDAYNRSIRLALVLEEQNVTGLLRDAWADSNLTWDDFTSTFVAFNTSLRLALLLEEANLTGLAQYHMGKDNATWASYNTTFAAFNASLRLALVLEEQNLTSEMLRHRQAGDATWAAWNGTFNGYQARLDLALALSEANVTGLLRAKWAHANATWAAWNATFAGYNATEKQRLDGLYVNLTAFIDEQYDSLLLNESIPATVEAAINGTVAYYSDSVVTRVRLDGRGMAGAFGQDILEIKDNTQKTLDWQEEQSSFDAYLERFKMEFITNALIVLVAALLSLVLLIVRGNRASRRFRNEIIGLTKLGGVQKGTELAKKWVQEPRRRRAGPLRAPGGQPRSPGGGRRGAP